jgi:hypothetical protein
MAIHDKLTEITRAHPHMAVAVIVLTTLSFSTWFLLEFFKPVGHRQSRAKLPPGPRGTPLFGSLLAIEKARNDPEHKLVRH